MQPHCTAIEMRGISAGLIDHLPERLRGCGGGSLTFIIVSILTNRVGEGEINPGQYPGLG